MTMAKQVKTDLKKTHSPAVELSPSSLSDKNRARLIDLMDGQNESTPRDRWSDRSAKRDLA
jgi:hypothetical protein